MSPFAPALLFSLKHRQKYSSINHCLWGCFFPNPYRLYVTSSYPVPLNAYICSWSASRSVSYAMWARQRTVQEQKLLTSSWRLSKGQDVADRGHTTSAWYPIYFSSQCLPLWGNHFHFGDYAKGSQSSSVQHIFKEWPIFSNDTHPFLVDWSSRIQGLSGWGFQRMALTSSWIGEGLLPGLGKGIWGSNCSLEKLLTNSLFTTPTQHSWL